ncbi:hypothetical protein DFR94_005260 [Clostridium beijerinckii]|nr:hypothetical protein [Clostridium beijerinckii]
MFQSKVFETRNRSLEDIEAELRSYKGVEKLPKNICTQDCYN